MTIGYIEKDFAPQDDDLEKINQFTRSEFTQDNLYIFNVALCNNDVDRDFEKFSTEALEQMKDKFLGKTGIFDHSMKTSDQKARIFDTWVEKMQGKMTADGEDFYQLKAKAYMVRNQDNQSLITDIEAGIKKEVSISCSMGKSTCSICGCDKRAGYCEHVAGREYNGKTAFTILSDVKDAYEFSFVAVPAQREAGVTKSFKPEKESVNMTDIIKTLKGCESSVTVSKSQAQEILNHIDSLNQEAVLGREYKKNLTNEVVALCAKAMPEMDLNTFSGVAQVMTTKELLTFKKAFSKSQGTEGASLQLKPEKATYAHSNYKI
jgi:hypothetical protein